MTTESLAHLFDRPRREGKGWRARCPVHNSKGLTLGIYPKDDRSILVCYAGCESDDILATVGLTWKDTLYEQRDPKAWREAQRKQREAEAIAYRKRIREWIRLFRAEGYSQEQYDKDASVAIATSQILSVEDKPHTRAILRISMERIIAASLLEKP